MSDNLFGLGILITVSDSATDSLIGISRAVEGTKSAFSDLGTGSQANIDKLEKSLNQTLVTGFALKEMGSNVSGISQAMISPLVNLSKEVISTSSQFEDWRVTLKALYKDADVAKEKLNWGMNLAASTPFEITDITEAMIGFKAMGVEVDAMFKNSNGQMRSFLEYVGDLGALRPDVGLNGVMMGIRNLMGGDGGRSLKARLDMDLEGILGRSFGDTPEQLMKDIVEVSDKVAGGLMMELEGTWSQIFSNLEDQMTRFTLAIGDGGAFDMAKKAIMPFYEVVQSIDDNKLARIGKNLAEGLGLVIKPIEWIVWGLSQIFKGLINLASKNSFISKFVVTFLALGGILTGLVGAFLSLSGGVLTTVATLGLFAIQIINNKAILMGFVGMLKSGIATVSAFMLKLALIGSLVAIAWKTDFLKIRSTLTTFVSDVKFAFDKSKEIASYSALDMERVLNNFGQTDFTGKLLYRMTQVRVFFNALVENWNNGHLSYDTFQKVQKLGLEPLVSKLNGFVNTVRNAFSKSKELMSYNVNDMMRVLNNLGTTNFEGRLIFRLTQIRVLFEALCQAWNSGELSTDTFKKVEALGLTPLVEFVLNAKRTIEGFFDGFKEGFKTAIREIEDFVGGVIDVIGEIIDNVNIVFEALNIEPIKFGEKLDVSGVEGVGKVIGNLAPKILLAWGGFKLFNGVVKTVYTVLKPVGWVMSTLLDVFAPIIDWALPKIIGGFKGFGKSVLGAIKTIGGLALANPKIALIVAGVMALIGAGIWLWKNWDTVKENFNKIIDAIKTKVDEWGQAFNEWFDNIIQGAIDWGISVGDAIKDGWNWVCTKTTEMKDWVVGKWNEMVTWVGNKVSEMVTNVSTWWSNLVTTVSDFCSNLWTNVTTWWSNIVTTVSTKVQEIWQNVCIWWSNIVTNVSTFCSNLWNNVTTWFSNIATTVSNKVQEAWQNACTWWNNIVSSAKEILSQVASEVSTAFSNVKTKIAEQLEKAWNTATEWWEKIKGIFSAPITATVNFVQSGLDKVKNVVSGKKKKKDGSHFNGLSFVPRDGYMAELHRGERVLTAKENKDYTKERNKVFQPNVTNNNSRLSNSTHSSNTTSNDNSVTFSPGSIVINVAQATTEEADRLAKIIMDKIQREQQLRSRLNYRVGGLNG